jgi:hypothetical protein
MRTLRTLYDTIENDTTILEGLEVTQPEQVNFYVSTFLLIAKNNFL